MFRNKQPMVRLAVTLTLAAASSAALAHTYERCDADGDHCVRVKCDADGDKCWEKSEYSKSTIYVRPGRWVCDSDGDRCHFEYKDRKWNPHWDHHDDDHDR